MFDRPPLRCSLECLCEHAQERCVCVFVEKSKKGKKEAEMQIWPCDNKSFLIRWRGRLTTLAFNLGGGDSVENPARSLSQRINMEYPDGANEIRGRNHLSHSLSLLRSRSLTHTQTAYTVQATGWRTMVRQLYALWLCLWLLSMWNMQHLWPWVTWAFRGVPSAVSPCLLTLGWHYWVAEVFTGKNRPESNMHEFVFKKKRPNPKRDYWTRC